MLSIPEHLARFLQPLDVLLYRGRWLSPVEAGIMVFSWSSYSHAALAFSWHGEWFVSDVGGKRGGDVRPIASDILAGRKIDVWRAPNRVGRAGRESRRFAVSAWQARGTVDYGYGKCLANAVGHTLARFSPRTDPLRIPERVFCSEWVDANLRKHLDFDALPLRPGRFTTPGRLGNPKRSRLERVHRVLTIE